MAGAIDLPVGTARRADQHSSLASQFIIREREFADARSLDDDKHERLIGERLRIEATGPTVLSLLDVMCQYEPLRSPGDVRIPRIPWYRRVAANWLSQTSSALMVPKIVRPQAVQA